MGTLPHRILRQKWRVAAGSEAEAFRLRKQFKENWDELIVPVFEKVFDELSGGDEILYIPKLEITVKVPGGSEMWETIQEELHYQLSETLAPKRYETDWTGKHNHPSDKQDSDKFQSGRPGFFNQFSEFSRSGLHETGDLFPGESNLVRIPAKQYRLEVLLHYLQYGNLPWQESPQANVASAELLAAIVEHRQDVTDYLHNYKVSPDFLFRLFQFLSNDEIISLSKDLCRHLSHAAKEELNSMVCALIKSGESGFNPHIRRSLLAAFVHAGISCQGQGVMPEWFKATANLVPPEKLEEFLRHIILDPGNSLFTPFGMSKEQDNLNPSENLESNRPAEENQNRSKERTSDSRGFRNVEGLLPKASEYAEYPGSPENLSSEDQGNDHLNAVPSGKHQDQARFMAQNAGLLLLHPFITSIFTHTGILGVDEKAIAFHNLPNAAALLHFLATGREEVYEFELGFVKILLGLDPDQPLTVSGGTLSNEQKEEAESLLNSVLGHWTALKNTSVSGLQTTFIQRSAMIYESEDGWSVHPEGKSFDILLNTIPWSYSIIKLPWMNKPIFTEWPTN